MATLKVKNAKLPQFIRKNKEIKYFEVIQDEKVLMLGPSGCGKTYFLEALFGLRTFTYDELEIEKNTDFIFQDLNLIEELSLFENLTLQLKGENLDWALLKLKSENFYSYTRLNQPIKLFSKGEQQRVSVIRSLAGKADLIFADEPTSHLDHDNAHRMMKYLTQESSTLLAVCHDLSMKDFFDKVYYFEELFQ